MKRACTRACENSAASPVRAKPRLSHGPRRRVRDVVQRSGPDSQACESNRASTPVRLRACAHQVVLAAQAALTLVGEAACWFAAWRIHRYAAWARRRRRHARRLCSRRRHKRIRCRC